MGYFAIDPQSAIAYDADYFSEYVKRSETDIGKQLNAFRLDFVRRHWPGPVLDVGIGSGAFIEAANSNYTGFDINPAAVEWLKARGIYDCPWAYMRCPEVVTCWDSLEHLEEPAELVDRVTKWVFVSLPIFSDVHHVLISKHYKPREHFWYWTDKGFRQWMYRLGFVLQDKSWGESDLGREDIQSYAFCRK